MPRSYRAGARKLGSSGAPSRGSQAVRSRVKGAVTASHPLLSPLPLHGLGRLGRIACHFLHVAAALIENLGGLAYLFSWNAAGYIFMAFSQQCSGSISNYGKKKGQSPVSCRRWRQALLL